MGDMPDLLPCPFCGGRATGFEWSNGHEWCSVVVEHDDRCIMEKGEFYAWDAESEAEAAANWNRRDGCARTKDPDGGRRG